MLEYSCGVNWNLQVIVQVKTLLRKIAASDVKNQSFLICVAFTVSARKAFYQDHMLPLLFMKAFFAVYRFSACVFKEKFLLLLCIMIFIGSSFTCKCVISEMPGILSWKEHNCLKLGSDCVDVWRKNSDCNLNEDTFILGNRNWNEILENGLAD